MIPIDARGEPELPHGEDEEDRERNAREEVRGGRATRLRAQVGIAEDEAQPFLQLDPERRLAPVDRRPLRLLLRLADAEEEQSRADEAERVDEHGVRSSEDLDEQPAEPRATDLGGGPADLELRVPFDDLVAIDEGRQVRLVGDVEEDLEDADEEADDVQLLSVRTSATYAIGTVT